MSRDPVSVCNDRVFRTNTTQTVYHVPQTNGPRPEQGRGKLFISFEHCGKGEADSRMRSSGKGRNIALAVTRAYAYACDTRARLKSAAARSGPERGR
jgi:hypothetical protein